MRISIKNPAFLAVKASASFTDAYTTNSGWTQTGTTVNVNSYRSGKVGWNISNPTSEFVVKSLGFTVSDTSCTCKISFKPDTPAVNGSHLALVSLTAGASDLLATNQDAFGIEVFQYTSGNTYYYISYKDGAGAYTIIAGTEYLSTITNGTYLYITLTRTSATDANAKFYDDSARTNLLATKTTVAIPSNVGGLTHVQHGNSKAANGDVTTGEADDITVT